MNRVRSSTTGYTIVEVMIFLAVSGLMFVAAMRLIVGQQAKADFQQGIRDFESQIQDIANDVSSGYFATNGDFTCTIAGGRPSISSTASATGTNVACIFVGRAIQFSPNDANNNTFDVYPVVGNKQVTTAGITQESQNLGDAKPTAIAPGTTTNTGFPSKKERNNIPGGISVVWVRDADSLPPEKGGFGIFTTFGSVAAGGNLQKGTVSVNIVPIGSGVNSPGNFVDSVNALAGSPTTPAAGMRLCLQSAGTNQYVIMTVGGSGRAFGTKTEFFTGDCGSAS